ncbi:hypothetical protein [Streptomyces clavuligerus]|nr:hypothetical protein [Streptomyces clavuligerus]ANW20510.1 hypothetical protein BB341_21005 [Streptomyces clavuligerus]AXU15136.1 hypothetical protein D1794_21860 [Streptomyces clavuligerus]EDY50184.1 conserved hypothetical protein [Streptomyces clavuligerus]QCS07911.1 hypothetical protein CRV15_21225 [Streptomyces clavuligerus]QPJ92753.1 hypothetical protein GE265_06875 [Streptomyces clavuligerus]
MAAARLTTTPTTTRPSTPRPSAAKRSAEQVVTACAPLLKSPLPAGRPREWYVTHNRRLKAMRLAIALLDTGVHHPQTADNGRIRATADRIGVHRPSDTTCRMVRALIRYGR